MYYLCNDIFLGGSFMINRKWRDKFLLAGSAFVISANTFGSLGTQSVSADNYFISSLKDLYKWLTSLFSIVQNFDSSSKVNESVNFDDVVKNILSKETKWSFDKNNNRYTTELSISLLGNFLVSVEPCNQENITYCVKVFENGGKTLVREFNIRSEDVVDDVKTYFQERVGRVEKLLGITREYNFFRFSKKSSEIISLVLPSNLKFNLDSGAGKEYVVSGMEYDLKNKLLNVYSSDYDAKGTPFLVCKNEKEMKNLLEKMSRQRKDFDYELITKAKDYLTDIFGDEGWTYCKEKNEYSVPFLVEGLTIPMSIKPTRFYGDNDEVICGYCVGYNDYGGYFFHTAHLDNSVREKLISMRDELAKFVRLFKALEKTGKFGNVQVSNDGLKIEAKENISVRSKFEYTNPESMEGVTRIALKSDEEPYLLKSISYQSNGPFATVDFYGGTGVVFDLEENNDKNLFIDFVEELLSNTLNENAEIGNQISQIEKLTF